MKQITIVVKDDRLAAILGCISGEFEELHVTEIAPPTAKKGGRRAPIRRHRVPGVRVDDLVLHLFKGDTVLTNDFVTRFLVEKGYSAESTSGVLSRLRKNGDIAVVGENPTRHALVRKVAAE